MANDGIAPSTATDVQQTKAAHKDGHKSEYPSHPLDPLSADEIVAVSLAVRRHIAEKTEIKAIRFITNSLVPPPKRVVLAHLGIPLTPGGKVDEKDRKPTVRKAEVDFLDVLTGNAYNYVLALSSDKLQWSVESIKRLPEGTQPQLSPGELLTAEEVVKKDPTVIKYAKEVGVEPHQIFADGWSIGYDDRFPKTQRIQQALLYARLSEHDNLYAHPLDFVPILDSLSDEVIHIDFPPTYSRNASESSHYDNTLISRRDKSTVPPQLSENMEDNIASAVEGSGRERITLSKQPWDFLPDLLKDNKDNLKIDGRDGWKEREAPKPLHVVQPEGVSFKMEGNVLEWQKWKMHIAFSHREGIALSTITYDDDGTIRPLFYRLSLAEMVVPYGDPAHPHPRKFAFDSGEYGMGTMANELSLGCDCLGQIHYLSGAYTGHDGSAVVIKNVICIHEEDAGLLWKHTDYRTGGRSHSVRSRRLVVSMVCTLANYEYIWNYFFYQDGSIEFEIRLTGILHVYTTAGLQEPTPYGTQIAPGINAIHHQHMFSLRIDPMLDGISNSVVETDIVPVDAPTGSATNFAGNGFYAKSTILQNSADGARTVDYEKDRRWKIVNTEKKHYATGIPVGYSLGMKSGLTPFMPRPDGWVGSRARFASKALWVVRDDSDKYDEKKEDAFDARMWPAGKYVPQARGEQRDSVGVWVREDGEKGLGIEQEDLVVFATLGTTHVARPEDWPVMPVEHLRLTLKPNSFFTANPSLDVPGGTDVKSVVAFGDSSVSSCCN